MAPVYLQRTGCGDRLLGIKDEQHSGKLLADLRGFKPAPKLREHATARSGILICEQGFISNNLLEGFRTRKNWFCAALTKRPDLLQITKLLRHK
jgi:hypothetical protein